MQSMAVGQLNSVSLPNKVRSKKKSSLTSEIRTENLLYFYHHKLGEYRSFICVSAVGFYSLQLDINIAVTEHAPRCDVMINFFARNSFFKNFSSTLKISLVIRLINVRINSHRSRSKLKLICGKRLN